MARMNLTAKSIAQMKPGKSRREIRDSVTQGLYLHVQPSGYKSWVMLLARPNGKIGKLLLGPVDLSGREASETPVLGAPLTLAGARWLAAELRRQRATGRDVVADREADKQIQKAKASAPDNTFAAVAQQFVDEYARPKTRRWRETAHCLGLDYKGENQPTRIKGGLAERWRDREVTTITSDDVYRIVDEAKRRGIPGLPCRTDGISDSRGRAMARVLSKLFSWALQHRKIKASPCVGVFVPPAPKSRDRVLTGAEIVRFWRTTEKVNEPFGPMLKLLLLTGARLREVAGMRQAELSPDGKVWTIPGVRTKNKRDHVVPLPPLACGILANVKQIGKAGFVFSTTGKSPVSGFSKTKKRLDELMAAAAKTDGVEILPWRIHDLRRTCATIMAESPPNGLGIAPHIVEACLNHISGHKVGVAGVYNKAEYLPEKKAALERWAVHVEGLVKGRPANVTPLHKERKR